MKLKIGIFSILAIAFMSCSADDIDNDDTTEEPLELNASISLSIANSVQTKSGDEVNLNAIRKLSLAVFVKDKLLSLTESEAKDGEPVTQISDVPIVAGAVKLILFANYDLTQSDGKDFSKKNTDIEAYKKLQVVLDQEENRKKNEPSGNGLTMSSDILEYNLAAGRNYIGFQSDEISEGNIVTSAKIKLHKNVSRVELDVVYLNPSDNYKGKGNVTFTLKEIFVANVKQYSHLIADGKNGVEVTGAGASFWLCGNHADATGALKEQEATPKDYLKYDLTNPPRSFDAMNQAYPFLNNDALVCSGRIAGLDEKNEDVIPITVTYPEVGGKPPHIQGGTAGGTALAIGTYFYVYENYHQENTPRTLLIVKGDYTYEPVEKGEQVTLEDRYYAVTINKAGESQVLSGAAGEKPDHNYVKRNNIYYINLTVKGPGSDSPYDIQEAAHMSALVKVKDWDVVNQSEEVD